MGSIGLAPLDHEDKLRLSLMRKILYALPCLRHVEQNCREKTKTRWEKKEEKGKNNKREKEKMNPESQDLKKWVRGRYQHSWSDRIMPAYSYT